MNSINFYQNPGALADAVFGQGATIPAATQPAIKAAGPVLSRDQLWSMATKAAQAKGRSLGQRVDVPATKAAAMPAWAVELFR